MQTKKGAFSGEISGAKQLWKHIFHTTETKDTTILDGRCLFFLILKVRVKHFTQVLDVVCCE